MGRFRAFNRKGFDIKSLEDVAQLDLRDIERRVQVKRLDIVYSSLVAVSGAAAGAVISGGELLASAGTVLGAGAAGAPGVGTVAAAMATDAAVVLGASSRAVAHIGMYYGFDPLSPAEAVYGMSIVNLGSAVTASGKVAAYAEVYELTQLLARRATWAQLNEHLLPRLAQQFAVRFGGRLTQRKTRELISIAGIGIGAGMNYETLTTSWTRPTGPIASGSSSTAGRRRDHLRARCTRRARPLRRGGGSTNRRLGYVE